MPAITVMEPLVAVLLGVLVYRENLRHTPWAIAIECGFLALFAAAALALTGHEAMAAKPSRSNDAHVYRR